MAVKDQAAAPPRRGWADKREAMIRAARVVFGRAGYTRAGIEAIAAEAGVSTRTIYNHFDDKQHLFHTVMELSSTEVADGQIALINQHFDTLTELEPGLIGFARAWATSSSEFGEHFALVRQINAEVGHIPQATLDRWQELGPRRVRRELARRMQQLADTGLLRIDGADGADFAANHFVRLTSSEITNRNFYGAVPLDEDEITRLASAGVRAFLYGYVPR